MKTKLTLFAALLAAMLGCQVQAQTRGFVETFDTSAVSDTWWLWADGNYLYPEWIDDTDPYISGGFTNDLAYLFADISSSSGKVVGNYAAARIAAIEADVAVDYPDEVLAVDLYFYSGYDETIYTFGYWHLPDTSWYRLAAPFDSAEWYVEGIGYTSVPAQALATIEEVGIIAYPASGLTLQTYVYLDNFSLIPELIRPAVTIDMLGGPQQNQPRLRFRAEQGQSYAVQWCDDLRTVNWNPLPGYTNIIGSGTTITVVDSTPRARCFYRVATDIHLSN